MNQITRISDLFIRQFLFFLQYGSVTPAKAGVPAFAGVTEETLKPCCLQVQAPASEWDASE
jgi:hypothetical protein